jgi:cystathionine gamma-synthase
MRAHGENAQRVAEMLTRHPAVSKVYFPGLASHPGHEIAKAQQYGFGGMVSFDLQGSVENVKALINQTRLFSLAESLGGVESLIAHPASMTHAAMDEAARTRAGISSTLIRLSVGIEDGDDLLQDLVRGLDAAMNVT